MLKHFANLLRTASSKQPYNGKTEPANVGQPSAPGYPPQPNSIPLLEPDILLSRHDDLLTTLRQTIGVADPIFDRLYIPALKRMASFVHLLPASESHHHRGAGGALRHAIEVANYTSRASESVMIGSLDLPVRRKEKEVAWRYAAFIAGLCHDVGKPVTDLTAHTEDGTQWNPMADSLHEWGRKAGASHYYLSWQPNRHKMHEQFYSMMVAKITGQEGMEYLGGVGHEAVGWVLSLGQAATIEQKKMYELVTKGDMLSVENDLRTHAGGASVAVAGVNLEKIVQDALQNRFRLGIWAVNKLGGRVWKTGAGVFLVWPIAGGEIIEDLGSMRALGLPRDPDALLSFMIERGLAVRMSEADGGESAVWKLKIPGNNGLTATVSAVRLSEDSGIPAILSGTPQLADRDTQVQPQHQAEAVRSAETAPPAGKGSEIPRKPLSVPPQTATPAALPTLEDMGPHGIILDYLKAEMASGKKKAGEDYIRLNDGRVAITFPEGLNGSGADPATIMEWLEENGMIETDPYQHDKKTHEIDGFNPPKRTRRTILFTKEATTHLGLVTHEPAPRPGRAQDPAREESAKPEDLPPMLRKFLDEIKRGKKEGNTPFMVEEEDGGLFVPRHSSISWFLKRCNDKNARLEIAAHLEACKAVKEAERNGKRMLFFPGSIL